MVSNLFYFHPYLGESTILTNIFQMAWNHQLETVFCCSIKFSPALRWLFFPSVLVGIPWGLRKTLEAEKVADPCRHLLGGPGTPNDQVFNGWKWWCPTISNACMERFGSSSNWLKCKKMGVLGFFSLGKFSQDNVQSIDGPWMGLA